MAGAGKITLKWDVEKRTLSCDTHYLKRAETVDVDLYITSNGTAYALASGWAINLSVKPEKLPDNAALIAITSWSASSTTGLYQATAQDISSTELDEYLAINDTTEDDESDLKVDVDLYYTVSGTRKARSDTVTLKLKPNVGDADDGTPTGTALSVTSSGYTMNTARILARWSAGSGAIQEATIGSGLSLSGSGELSASGGAAITITNTIFVDATAGSDSNAGTLAAPKQTLAGAKAAATSGTLVKVQPGTYSVTAPILKDGTVWDCVGSTINFSNNSTDYGPLDDGGAAITCRVIGGDWNRTETSAGSMTSVAALCATRHASSIVDLNNVKLTATFTSAGAAYVVWGFAGKLSVRNSRGLYAGGNSTAVCIAWTNGTMYVHATEAVTGSGTTGYGVFSFVSATPTGDLYVRLDTLDTTASATAFAIDNAGSDTTAVAWLDILTVKVPTGSASRMMRSEGGTPNGTGNNKIYLRSQKVFGRVQHDGGGLFYLDSDKWQPMNNATSTSGLFGSFVAGTAWLNVTHYDPVSYTSSTGGMMQVNGGTVTINGGQYVANSSSRGIYLQNGTCYVNGLRCDTSANSAAYPLNSVGGTAFVNGCSMACEATSYDIIRSGGTVTVTGGSGSGTNGAITTAGTVGFTKAPTALLADSATAVSVGGITGLGTGVATFLATPSSANLASAVTDETGSGKLVFATSPTFTTGITLNNAGATNPNQLLADVAGYVRADGGLSAGSLVSGGPQGGGGSGTVTAQNAAGTNYVSLANNSIAYGQTGGTLTLSSATLTGTRTQTFTDATGTIPLLQSTQTWSSANTFSGSNSFTGTTQTFTLPTTTGTGATAGLVVTANSLTTGEGVNASTSSLTSGVLVKIDGTSAATVNGQSLLRVANSGVNSDSSALTYAARFINTRTGTGSTNIAASFQAQSGTSNYAIYVTHGAIAMIGNQSHQDWGTTGVGIVQAAATWTNSSSSGTSTTSLCINGIGQPTINSTSSTFADVSTWRMTGPPIAGTGSTITRPHSLTIVDSTASDTSIKGAVIVCTTEGTNATSISMGGGKITSGSGIGTDDAFYVNPTASFGTYKTIFGSNTVGLVAATNILWATGTLYSSGTVDTTMSRKSAGIVRFGATASTSTGSIEITNLTHVDGGNQAFGTTTGTKMGTATSQKIAFWNATPIVQPTTGVASATIVAGAGTTVKEDHTFDGYTIAQIVKALRNAGLLA